MVCTDADRSRKRSTSAKIVVAFGVISFRRRVAAGGTMDACTHIAFHASGDEDRRGVLGSRRLREFVRKMGRRGRPEVLALQLPQGPEQLTVTNLGPASKLLQEGGQERVALQHIQRVCGSDHLPLLRIRELEGQGRVP